MKYLLVFLFSYQGLANWQEVNCSNLIPADKKSQISMRSIISYRPGDTGHNKKWNNIKYRVIAAHTPGKPCSYILRTKKDEQVYQFGPSGEISFTNIASEKMQVFFTPIYQRELKMYIHQKTGAVKFELINGSTIFFDPSSGKINNKKTSDFIFQQDSPHKFSIQNPNRVLIKFNGKSSNLDAFITLNKNHNSCSIKAKALFNYQYKCGSKKVLNGYQVNYCSSAAQDIKENILKNSGEYKNYFINGVGLKDNFQEILYELSKTKACAAVLAGVSNPQMAASPYCQQKLAAYFTQQINSKELRQYISDKSLLAVMKIIYMAQKIKEMKKEGQLLAIISKIEDKLDQQKEVAILNEKLLASPLLYLKLLALKYKFQQQVPAPTDNSIQLTNGELKILRILIQASAKSDSNFNNAIDNLLNMALKENKNKEFDADKFSKIEKRIENLQQKALNYLFNEECYYVNQFLECKEHSLKNIDEKFLFNDSKKIIEFLYQRLIK